MEAAVGPASAPRPSSSPLHADIKQPKLNIRSVPASSAGFATWGLTFGPSGAAAGTAGDGLLDSLAAVVKRAEMDVPKALAEAAGESLSESRLAREAAVDRLEDAAVHARNSHAHAEWRFSTHKLYRCCTFRRSTSWLCTSCRSFRRCFRCSRADVGRQICRAEDEVRGAPRQGGLMRDSSNPKQY